MWKLRRSAAPPEPDPFHLFFAGRRFPRHIAEDNFLFGGTRGSGKTLSIRLLTQSVVDGFIPGSRRKALIYDPKGDWPSIAHGMLEGLQHQGKPYRTKVKLLNPFDSRGYAYDIAADFASLGGARHRRALSVVADGFAKSLIPDDGMGNDNVFWMSSAQSVISGLAQSFAMFSPDRWTFRDLISAACDEQLTRAVLDRDPMTKRVLARFSKTGETEANVLQTVASFTWDIEAAATAWEHHYRRGRRFTFTKWFGSEDILILCGNYNPRAALEPVNGVIMNFAREHCLNQDEVDWSEPIHPETWFILDEFPKLHAIPDMEDFFTLTRSKGGVQVVGFQSVTDMHKRYGEDGGDTILGLCGHLGAFRLTCPKTAAYFEDRIGSYEVFRHYRSTTEQTSTSYTGREVTGRSVSRSTSDQWQFHTLPGVLKQEFYRLKPVRRTDLAIDGWYSVYGHYDRVRYSAREAGLLDKDETCKNLVRLNPKLYEPRPWNDEDFSRLGVKMPHGYRGAKRKAAVPPKLLTKMAKRWASPTRNG